AMFRHQEEKVIPHARDDVMDLVLDIARYPEFLPWCKAARINSAEPGLIIADLIVGFAAITETFTSCVEYDKEKGFLRTTYVSGPLETMQSDWQFSMIDAGCKVSFAVELAFRSKMLNGLFAPLFQSAIVKMVSAFEQRAEAVLVRC
ncbi:MAG: type II toxin-antitoxin system RatA family toxin, partial [Pseudomonadota bacterium]